VNDFYSRLWVIAIGMLVGFLVQAVVLLQVGNGEWARLSSRRKIGIVLTGGVVALIVGLGVARVRLEQPLPVFSIEVLSIQIPSAATSSEILRRLRKKAGGKDDS
jgi:heme A synthase